ncbi:hypothetical protein Tco_1298422, partial [Tanacetum coccineum]
MLSTQNRLPLCNIHGDESQLKEDVGSISVWVKFHGVLRTAFSEDGLSIIATKLANEELKDSIVVDMPKLVSEGFNMCTVRVELRQLQPLLALHKCGKLRYNANAIWDGLALGTMMRNFKCNAMMRAFLNQGHALVDYSDGTLFEGVTDWYQSQVIENQESVGTSTARVILFGTIPTIVQAIEPTVDLPVIHDDTPLIPIDTPTISPIVPTIPPIASTIQYTSIFICTSLSDIDTSKRPPSHDLYEVTVARGRNRVAARSSPPSPPIRQILPAPPRLPRRPAILVLPRQPIPVGRPYRTHPNRVLKMLTARKRVGPLPTHRLALRYTTDYSSLDHFTLDDSSQDSPSEALSDSHSDTLSDSSSRHSSSGYVISDSPCDSSTAIFARPSRKRCRSPTSSVPVASPVCRALSPVRADLLPPHKRIWDSDSANDFEVSSEEDFEPYVPREIGLGVDVEDSYEPYTELDIDPDVQADIDACIVFADDIAARGTNVRVEIGTAAEEEAESSTRGTIEIEVDQVTHPVVSDDTTEPVGEESPELVSADGSLERDQRHRIVATSHQSVVMSKRIGTLERDNRRLSGMLDVERQRVDRLRHSMTTMPTATRTGITQDVINELIAKRVEEALKAYDAAMNLGTEMEMENDQQDNNVKAHVNNGN